MPSEDELNAICYPNNYLTRVIARIDLVSPVEALANELPKELSKAALGMFPISEPRQAVTQELFISPQGPRTRNKRFTVWNFHGKTREKRLEITQQYVLVSYSKYEKYELLRNEFDSILNAFFGEYNQAQPSKLGLRYINALTIGGEENPLKWDTYINNELLDLFGYQVEGAKPARIFHNMEFAFDNFCLRFQFGIHNPDYPAPIRQRHFILDFDAYNKGLLEPTNVITELDSFHTQIQHLFERSITETTRGFLNEVK